MTASELSENTDSGASHRFRPGTKSCRYVRNRLIINTAPEFTDPYADLNVQITEEILDKLNYRTPIGRT